jgi:hypothetical protein
MRGESLARFLTWGALIGVVAGVAFAMVDEAHP